MFEVDLKGRKSIYEQVVDNFKEQILVGVIASDEKLPSVRELSKNLTVNPNTVQKAYRELERQGYIYTVAGIGVFARAKEEIEPDEKLISDVKARLSDEIKELFYIFPNEEIVQGIICDTIAEIKLQLLTVAREEKVERGEISKDDKY